MTKANQRNNAPRDLSSSLGSALEDLLRHRQDLAAGLNLIGSQVFNGTIGRHIRPVRLEGDVLHVESSDPSWTHALEGMEGDVLREINKLAPNVRRIQFGSGAERPEVPLLRPAIQRSSESIDEAIVRLTQAKAGKTIKA